MTQEFWLKKATRINAIYWDGEDYRRRQFGGTDQKVTCWVWAIRHAGGGVGEVVGYLSLQFKVRGPEWNADYLKKTGSTFGA